MEEEGREGREGGKRKGKEGKGEEGKGGGRGRGGSGREQKGGDVQLLFGRCISITKQLELVFER